MILVKFFLAVAGLVFLFFSVTFGLLVMCIAIFWVVIKFLCANGNGYHPFN